MKLYELQGFDRIRGNISDLQIFNHALAELGWTKFDYGGMAFLYENPDKDYIVKLFFNDQCYYKFLSVVQKNKSNQHFPKFRGKVLKMAGVDDVMAVRMERLSKLTKKEFYDDHGFHAWLVIHYGADVDTFDLLNQIPIHQLEFVADEWKNKNRSFVNALIIVKENLSGPCEPDFKPDNFMKRGDTWIITDPYV